MRKYLINGVAALAMGLAITSCTKEFNYEEQEQQASLDNAQQTLGFYIPENQDWVMTSTISANIPINFEDGETYTIKVYSNDPLADGVGYVLAKETVSNGHNFSTSFRAPSYRGAYSIGITNSNGETMYRTAYLEDGQLTEFIEDKPVEVSTSRTRAITVNGDNYDTFNFPSSSELASAFPTSIPANAEEVSDLETLYKGKVAANGNTMWDLYAIYLNQISKDYNLKVTKTGTVEVGHYQNGINNLYNVYVDVDGDVTIKRPQNAFYRLYILRGNVTLDSNFGEMAGLISVAKGATLNDPRNHTAANDGIKIYNRGTINATNSGGYDIGNNSTVYNENKFYVSGPLSYSPGSANTSYFINYSDDAELTAPSMTMNSTCHFYTDGKVIIAGATYVTQQAITWINNGHYTTGSIKFSAQNSTFYNYCQLIVTGDGCFKDGSFNMMDNSYAEVNKGVFNNFYVNMGNNSGFNIKNGTRWGLQGQGTPQGFFAKDDNAKAFVRLGGNNEVPAHVGGAFQVSGANLVLAYNSIKFFEGASIGDTYDGSSTWNETNAETLQKNKDGRITWKTNNVTKFVTGDDFSTVEVETVEGQCSANWTVPGEPVIEEDNQTWTYAFEDNKTKCDFDLNDVVIQVKENKSNSGKLDITLVAAGCQYDNYVWLGNTQITWEGGAEVHNAFGVAKGVMVNTGRGNTEAQVVTTTIDKPSGFDFQNADFKIRPFKINSDPTDESNAVTGYITIVKEGNPGGLAEAPLGIAIPDKWKWPLERINVTNAYEGFTAWGSQEDLTLRADLGGWYQEPTEGMVYGE